MTDILPLSSEHVSLNDPDLIVMFDTSDGVGEDLPDLQQEKMMRLISMRSKLKNCYTRKDKEPAGFLSKSNLSHLSYEQPRNVFLPLLKYVTARSKCISFKHEAATSHVNLHCTHRVLVVHVRFFSVVALAPLKSGSVLTCK